jgi:hypothetical protein
MQYWALIILQNEDCKAAKPILQGQNLPEAVTVVTAEHPG